MIKYVGPKVIYKIIVPHKYLLMMLGGKILRGIRVNIRTSHGHVNNLAQLKQIINKGLSI